MKTTNRRDFLRLAGLASSATYLNQLAAITQGEKTNKPNIIVLVFDALAARNMSLYGYPRKTTPHIDKFAEHSTVFNDHYSAGSYTTPGTASLLTGLYPWTHRALRLTSNILEKYSENSIFHAISSEYTKFAFTQNIFAELFLDQFHKDIDIHPSPESFGLVKELLGDGFHDPVARYRAFEFFLSADDPASLLFGSYNRFITDRLGKSVQSPEFPDGMPQVYDMPIYYRIDDVFRGLAAEITKLPQPFFAYLHVYPPHDPYHPGRDFINLFNDGWESPKKPRHELGDREESKVLTSERQLYDQFIAYTDWGFGIFHDLLNKAEIFDNSHLVITSDHGELFERGVEGHVSPLMYESVIRTPLIISSPGQVKRENVDMYTSSVDLVPTVASLTSSLDPIWGAGELLPHFGGVEDKSRSIYSFDAKLSPTFGQLSPTSTVLRKGDYKLIYYVGYKDYKGYKKDPRYESGMFELYNIREDSEELVDLISIETSVADELKKELLEIHKESTGPLSQG